MRTPESEPGRASDRRFLLPDAVPAEVHLDPRREQLEEAFASLRPGAACYFEWRPRLRPSARSLRARLAAAGFVGVRLYWSWPPDDPSVWVPLEAPAAARWVLRRRARKMGYLAWRVLRALGLLRPRCATAVRPPLAEHAGPLGTPLAGLGGTPIWALLAPGRDPLNKVLAFVGVQDRDDPLLVLKLPRTEDAAPGLEREAAALQALEAARPPVEGVPRLLFSHRDGDALLAIAESPLAGRPLFEALDHRRHAALVDRATDWLIQLGRPRTGAPERAETASAIARDAAAGGAAADGELLVEAGRLASTCESLPVVFEQRDFSPWNVHLDHDGHLVVFDWESAEPAGFPALDLVYLLTYCGFFLDGALESGQVRESYRSTVGGSVAAACLTRYCDALGIDVQRIPALRALTWLVHARAALHRAGGDASAALFLDLLSEEVNGGGGGPKAG